MLVYVTSFLSVPEIDKFENACSTNAMDGCQSEGGRLPFMCRIITCLKRSSDSKVDPFVGKCEPVEGA
jgi:hypothetical protein